MQARDAGSDGALRRILQRRTEGSVDLPVGRVVPAELRAELLAQELLRPSGARIVRLTVRLNARAPAPRRLLLLRRDEAFGAHSRKHHAAPVQRAVVVRPRRE